MRTFCLTLMTGIALLGCEEPASTFTATTGPGSASPAHDADGDGYTADVDCDDDSFVVNPGADEICDGIDNDCDGLTDDDDDGTDPDSQHTFFADADGDGYGDPASPQAACAIRDGLSETADDCDDAEAASHPGAEEVCDGIDNDCDGDTDDEDTRLSPASAGQYYIDDDGDGFGRSGNPRMLCEPMEGYASVDGDCADLDPQTHPDAAEICDGVDNNCDGRTDDADAGLDPDSRATFHADADGDGFGDADSTAAACEAPSGYTADDTDCDDTDAAVSPDASELCDGIDNDCDGLTDDADTLAEGAAVLTFYIDGDGDGHGDAGWTTGACEAPAGYTADATDCDDTDAAVSPSAQELCDGIDNDCDGDTDRDATDAATFYADADGDGFGSAADTAAACEAPDGYTADATDCDDTDAAVSPSAEEVCDAVDNDCDGDIDDYDTSLTNGVVYYRDFDADGFGHDDYSITACAAPDRYTEVSGDCDDDDDTSNPDAAEVCDGADNDCDGTVDQAFISEDFEGDYDGLTATGDLTAASDDSGGYILLTADTDEASAIFFEETVPGGAWAITATVSMDDGEGNTAGTGGITLAFLSETDPGVLGGDLGVGGLSGYAIELDIDGDAEGDPDGNHIALIETDTMTHIAIVSDIPTLEGAGEIVVEVVVDGDLLEVSLDGVVVMSETLAEELTGEVLLGITASSGDPAAIQTLDDLIISCP